jgi:hypothetical protein
MSLRHFTARAVMHPGLFRVLPRMLADRPDGRRLTAEEQRQLDDLERRLVHGPPAPARPRPVGRAAAPHRPADRRTVVAGALVLAALLVLATVVGGVGGAAATASALLATSVLCWLSPGIGRSPGR